jgi:PAS domain S-box-containing protein
MQSHDPFLTDPYFWSTVAAAGLIAGLLLWRTRCLHNRNALLKRLRVYASVINPAPDALSLVGTDYTYRLVNDEYQRRTGLRRDQIEGRTVAEVMGEESFRTMIKPYLERALAGETVEYESWFDYGALGRRRMLIRYSPFRDDPDAGVVDGVVVCAHDVTARWRAEEVQRHTLSLRESEQRFRTMADGLPAPIWVTGATGAMEFANERFCEYFGLSAEHIAGLDWSTLVHPEDLDEVRERFDTALSGRRPFNLRCRLRRADGSWRWFDCSARPRFDDAGGFLGFVGSSHDITRRRQVEQALRRSRRELKRRSEQLALLATELTRAEQSERRRLGRLLHDHLQQLLVGASLSANRLSRRLGGDSEELAKLKDLLTESLDASRTLMADLCPPVLYEGVLADALRWLARSMRDKTQLRVTVDADDRVDVGDETLRVFLFESVREALLNVVKHAGVGEARVRLRLIEGRRLQVEVTDQGGGFDTSVLCDARHTDGLGLVSIRERMRMLGGGMQVSSRPGEGTRLTLVVPVAGRRDGAMPEGITAHGAVVAGPALQASSAAPDRIGVLLVDDHAVMRDGLAMLLDEEADVEVVGQAANGQEAIAQVEALLPEVVLMDFSMPVMDGVTATRVIHERWPSVRVIGLSLYKEQDRAAAMLEAGASDYVCKTEVADELLAKIRGHTTQPQAQLRAVSGRG